MNAAELDELRRLREDLRKALRRVDAFLAGAKRRPRGGQRYQKAELIRSILAQHPCGLDIHALVAKLRKAGYPFAGDPVKSTRTLLYSRREFRSEGGVFKLA